MSAPEESSRRYLEGLTETAKANGVEPFAYLRQVLTQLPGADTAEAIENILPWNIPSA